MGWLMSYRDQYVWITGASSGIGAALAQALAAQGAHLLLSARRESELRRVQQLCSQQGEGGKVEILPFDLSDGASVAAAAERAQQILPRLDVLLLSAGVSQRSLAKDTLGTVDRAIMELNYFGPVELTRRLLPRFISQKQGHIVVISSVAGKLGSPLRSSYSASKHALHGYFDCLRAEMHADGLSVTVVCPGYIATDITLNSMLGDGRRYGKVDQALKEGMPVDKCAQQILRGMARKKAEFVVSDGKEKYAVWLKRLLPGLLFRVVRSHVPV